MEILKPTKRFDFGRNWKAFSANLSDEQIARAEQSMVRLLGSTNLCGKRFVDVGCGSGLSSLIARRLGAEVHSFDFDSESAECTRDLKRRFLPDDANWKIETGDILDAAYVGALPRSQIVYSWGVLHHTGDMWSALENAARLVDAEGMLIIALYNDQGWKSATWKKIKEIYVKGPKYMRFVVLYLAFLRLWGPSTIRDLCKFRPFETWRQYSTTRGMSPWYDVIDWVGGYPFDVTSPQEVVNYMGSRGFDLTQLFTVGTGHGCNEYVFIRSR